MASASQSFPRPHDLKTRLRLQGADQHRVAGIFAADQVQAPVDAVGAVDVGPADRPEHRRVAGGGAVEGVRGGILVVVGLGLDDPSADAVQRQRPADQVAGDRDRMPGEDGRQIHLIALQRPSR
jgi:hypothetical protein